MYALTKSLPALSNHLLRSTIFFSRKLTSQQQVIIPSEETLTDRIFHYLNSSKERNAQQGETQKDLFNNYLKSKAQLYKMNDTDIVQFSKILSENSIPKNEQLLILKELDVELCMRLSQLNYPEILELLTIYMHILPSRITEFAFYKKSLNSLFHSLPKLDRKQLLQFMFYVGLRKKCVEAQTMLRESMREIKSNFIDTLTLEELCIICNVTFKTSTKITNKDLLEKVRNYISQNLSVLKDPALFVTLVKTLRHNKYQNDDLLNTISNTVLFNKTYKLYTFPVICHILALFTDYHFYDGNLTKLLIRKCIDELDVSTFSSKKAHPVEQIRGKDIKRLLWILSMFCEMKLCNDNEIKNVIIPKIIDRITGGEFDNDLNSLVDVTLYLWMLNYRAYELVPYVFKKELGVNARNNVRLQVLLNAIRIEDYPLAKTLLIRPISIPCDNYSKYQVHRRPTLQRVYTILNQIKKDLNLSKFEYAQEIPYLNIVGITGFNQGNKTVYVEVLDEFNRLKNVESVANGQMSLKLRLLDSSEQGVLLLPEEEVQSLTDKELKEYLLDELKLII